MSDIQPPIHKLSKKQRAQLPRDARGQVVRESGRTKVAIADADQVRAVLRLMLTKDHSIGQACGLHHVSPDALWRRINTDPELRAEMAAMFMHKVSDRCDRASHGLNPASLAIFAKLGRDAAASLNPSMWGDKVQVESRQLVINCNLDFSVADGFDGIVLATKEPDEPV